jgi:hypothetical protein
VFGGRLPLCVGWGKPFGATQHLVRDPTTLSAHLPDVSETISRALAVGRRW